MDEQNWLTSTDPKVMLEFLEGRVSGRKLRLFACACYREVDRLLYRPEMIPERSALDVAERFAEGLATESEREQSWAAEEEERRWDILYTFAQPVLLLDPFEAAVEAAWNAPALFEEYEGERWIPDELIREVFGNPFHPVKPNPSCLTPPVVTLAQSIYDHRSFDRLPELAQALQEAGCEDAKLLGHLRSPGPHAKGCWGLDAVLGKS